MKSLSSKLPYAFLCSALLLALGGIRPAGAAGSWTHVGTAGFTPRRADSTTLAFSGDTPYVAYSDYPSYKATVKYYDGGAWQTLGAADFSPGAAQYISLAFPENSSTPYVAYQDGGNGLKATVKYYDGNAWQTLGTEGFSDGQIQYTSLAFAGKTPYLAYMDPANGYEATVKYYDGNAWQTLGTEAFSANQVDFISLAISAGTPYVAYRDAGHSSKVTVMYYDGAAWQNLGTPGFSPGGGDYESLVFSGGTPYVAFRDWANGNKLTVMYYDGSAWQTLGTPGFSPGAVASYVSMAFVGGTPYVVYQDNNNGLKATAMYYDGSAWQVAGTAGFSGAAADYTSLAVSGGTPYVAYRDNGHSQKATVMKFDVPTTTTAWTTVGTAGFTPRRADNTALAFSGDTPYVAYSDYPSYKATVKYYDGGAWQTLGAADFSPGAAQYISLAFPENSSTPYVAYQDGGNGLKATVKYYDGNAWQTLGTEGFSDGQIQYTSLAFAGKTPYLAYMDPANGYEATVKYYDGNAWQTLGTEAFSANQVDFISLAISAGTPYVAYRDAGNGFGATVMYYDGAAWQNLGTPGFSPGGGDYESLVFSGGTPYVAFRDWANGNKLTVMYYDGSAWQTLGTPGFSPGAVASYVSMAFVGGTPYVVYQDNNNGLKATAMYYDGSAWQVAGTAGFSGAAADYTSLAVSGGTPYVAYRDNGHSQKATVMKFVASTQTGPDFVVNSNADTDDGLCDLSGQGYYHQDCTLREAINAANADANASGITFANDYTITLAGSSLPNASTEMTIDGTGSKIAVSGNDASAVFSVASGVSATLQNLTVTHGSAASGAGLSNDGGAVVIKNSAFTNHTATGSGGALYNGSGTLTVINSTFSNNSATGGASLAAVGGTVTIYNSSFSGGSGGEIARSGGTVKLTNSLIDNATATCTGTITDGGHNLDRGTGCDFTASGSLSGTAPLLGSLANYGGDTPTLPLLPGSPAIDAGDATTCADAGTVNAEDARGVARPQNGTCDIGAFESQGFTLTPSAGDGQSTPINSAFPTDLTATVTPTRSGDPVDGGQVTFTAPGSGASAILATSPATVSSGTATVSATANGAAGGYSVTAGAAGASVIAFSLTNAQATATVSLGDLSQTYDGSPKSATCTTNPSGLTTSITYNGSGTAPTNAGSYTVVCTVSDVRYLGSDTQTLIIAKAAQASLTAHATPSGIPYGGTSALSTTGGSGEGTVGYAVTAGASHCSIIDTTLTGTGVGTCAVTATKAADSNYNAAIATVDVTVAAITTITGTPLGGNGPTQVDLNGGGVGCGFTRWQFEAAANPPAGIDFPYGVLAFTLTPCSQHGTVTLRFTYPAPLPAETQFWKFGPTAGNHTPHWYTLPATVNGNQLTVEITDGELGDDDLVQNGVITDPSGAGVPTADSGPVAIPALSLWGLGLLVALLGGAGRRAGTRGFRRR